MPAINPGVVDTGPHTPPHPPGGQPGTGPSITFARSGLTVNWSSGYPNILEFAEACDVPTRFACRSGVCHVCETDIVTGTITYVQAPLEPPGPATVLICSAAPTGDLVLDL
jgi:ferredoxin